MTIYDDRYKYPRTFHFDWSLSLINDDRRLPSLDGLIGNRVVVTEKFDGENTSLYRDASHARSMDSRHHASRDWCKSFHGEFAHKIPDGFRVIVENCYATHSILYRQEFGNALPSLAIGLSIWDDKNVCLSWDESLLWFEELGIAPARVLYDGIWDEALFRQMAKEQDPAKVEGYVVRVADAIPYGKWFLPAGKYVRSKHVNTTQHWMTAEIVPNEMMTPEQIEAIGSNLVSGTW
jgi:hypothetical protein